MRWNLETRNVLSYSVEIWSVMSINPWNYHCLSVFILQHCIKMYAHVFSLVFLFLQQTASIYAMWELQWQKKENTQNIWLCICSSWYRNYMWNYIRYSLACIAFVHDSCNEIIPFEHLWRVQHKRALAYDWGSERRKCGNERETKIKTAIVIEITYNCFMLYTMCLYFVNDICRSSKIKWYLYALKNSFKCLCTQQQ